MNSFIIAGFMPVAFELLSLKKGVKIFSCSNMEEHRITVLIRSHSITILNSCEDFCIILLHYISNVDLFSRSCIKTKRHLYSKQVLLDEFPSELTFLLENL